MATLKNKKIVEEDTYDYVKNLNWRDDGNELEDPSMNDYLKGYNMRPYDFVQWAKKENKIVKKAAKEVVPMHFYPEYLADYILTLWNGTDGTLQDFFNGFTLRYNNNLKESIAKSLNKMGYEIYPVYVDDRAFFAKRAQEQLQRIASADLETKLYCLKNSFRQSEPLMLFFGEISDMKEIGKKITAKKVVDLLDYYSEIFPEDFAISLTKNLVVDKGLQDVGFEYYKDFGMTDKTLEETERILSGNDDSYYDIHSGNEPFGWDYVSDMRGFDGVRPEQYETTDCTNNNPPHLAFKKKD